VIEFTGNIEVHHPDRIYQEDLSAVMITHAAAINRLQQDQHNPDGQ
jgi:hypothetical protein